MLQSGRCARGGAPRNGRERSFDEADNLEPGDREGGWSGRNGRGDNPGAAGANRADVRAGWAGLHVRAEVELPRQEKKPEEQREQPDADV